MKTFAELFKKYRLRAEFDTFSAFSDALSKKGYFYEESIFSHWQKGTRTPADRQLVLAMIEIFAEHQAIKSKDEADEFLASTGLGYLTESEKKQLGLIDSKSLFASIHPLEKFSEQSVKTESYELLLEIIKNSSDSLNSIEQQIDMQYKAIYDGNQAKASNNLIAISELIKSLNLQSTKEGRRLLSRAQAARIRCFTDMFTLKTYSAVMRQSNLVFSYTVEKNSDELGFAFWADSTVRRLKMVMEEKDPSKKEAEITLRMAQLALLHTPESNVPDRVVEYLEIAKIFIPVFFIS